MMMPTNVWECLGIAPTDDSALIRKAYAQQVRRYRPDSHPIEFAALRSAYEQALQLAQAAAPASLHESAHALQHAPDSAAENARTDPAPPPDSAPAQPGTDQTATAQTSAAPERLAPYDWNQDAEHAAVLRAMAAHDLAWLQAWLEQTFAKARQGTFDAMQDFEALICRLLLQHNPPLAFVEACAARLDWAQRWPALVAELGSATCMRLRGLLELAVQYRFSAGFAANRWQRALFADASVRLPWAGSTGLLIRAHHCAQQWQKQCETLRLPAYLALLNPRVMAHLEGDRLQSCDIVHGMFIALYALLLAAKLPSPSLPWWGLTLVGVLTLLACAGFRPLWRGLRKRVALEQPLMWLRKAGLVVAALALAYMLAEHEIKATPWMEWPARILGWTVFAYALTIVLWFHWAMVRLMEPDTGTFRYRKMDSADSAWWERERGEHGDDDPLVRQALSDHRVSP